MVGRLRSTSELAWLIGSDVAVLQDALAAPVGPLVVALPELGDGDALGRAGVRELAAAQVDADVGHLAALQGVEEDHVAGLEGRLLDLVAELELGAAVARQLDGDALPEDGAREGRAVDAAVV